MSKVNNLNKKFICLCIFVWNGKEYLIKRFLMLVNKKYVCSYVDKGGDGKVIWEFIWSFVM